MSLVHVDETHDEETILEAARFVAHLSKGMPETPWAQGNPGMTPWTCGADGEKAQVILVWVRAPSVGNASHPRGLGVMKAKP